MTQVDGFTFYKSYYESSKNLEALCTELKGESYAKEVVGEFYRAIVEYMFSGNDITGEIDKFAAIAFELAKPFMDVSISRSKSGSKTKKIKKNFDFPKKETGCYCSEEPVPVPVPDTVQVPDEDNTVAPCGDAADADSDSREDECVREVIAHLNDVCDTSFSDRKDTETFKLVRARLREPGVDVGVCKHVIDVKAAQWLNDERMAKYLRPRTLFAKSNFEGYRNERGGPPGISVQLVGEFDGWGECGA